MTRGIINDNLIEKTCRICLEINNPNNMINPCKCNGTSKYVHKKCLQQWISQTDNFIAKYKCMECNHQYKYKSNISQIYSCICILPIHVLYIIYTSVDIVTGYILYSIYPNILFSVINIESIWIFISCVNVTAFCNLILLSIYIFLNIMYYNFNNINRIKLNCATCIIPICLTFLSIILIIYYSILVSYIINLFVKIQITDNYYKYLDLYKFNNIVELLENYIQTDNEIINNITDEFEIIIDEPNIDEINDSDETDDEDDTHDSDETDDDTHDSDDTHTTDEYDETDTGDNIEIIEIVDSVKNILINS